MPASSKPLRVTLVTHEQAANVENAGEVALHLAALGHELIRHEIFPLGCKEPNVDFPVLDGIDLVVVFGSFSHAWDPASWWWVDQEVAWLVEALRRQIPVLGICFGGQLLSLALGGHVTRANEPEFGMLTFDGGNDEVVANGPWFSWHSDIVDLPSDVTVTVANDIGPQVFRHGRCLGLQFHPEVTRELAAAWIAEGAEELDSHLTGAAFNAQVDQHVDEARFNCHAIVDHMVSVARRQVEDAAGGGIR